MFVCVIVGNKEIEHPLRKANIKKTLTGFHYRIFFSCLVPVTKTEEPNLAGTLQLKITGNFDSKADSHSGMESYNPDHETGFDNSDLEESEDRNSSKLVDHSSPNSIKLSKSSEDNQLSQTKKLEGKNINGNGKKV